MRVMTVRARNSFRVHPALRERSPVVDLVAHLPVVPVEGVVEPRESMRIERRLPMYVIIGETARTPMASRARLDLAGALLWRAPFGVAGFGHRRPHDPL